MIRRFLPIIPLAALGMAAGCAPTADSGEVRDARTPRQCFFTSNVNSFREGTERDNIIVRVGTRDEFELTPLGTCRDISWARGILLVPALGEGGSLCTGDYADVRLAGGGVSPGRCQVRVLRKVEQPANTTDEG